MDFANPPVPLFDYTLCERGCNDSERLRLTHISVSALEASSTTYIVSKDGNQCVSPYGPNAVVPICHSLRANMRGRQKFKKTPDPSVLMPLFEGYEPLSPERCYQSRGSLDDAVVKDSLGANLAKFLEAVRRVVPSDDKESIKNIVCVVGLCVMNRHRYWTRRWLEQSTATARTDRPAYAFVLFHKHDFAKKRDLAGEARARTVQQWFAARTLLAAIIDVLHMTKLWTREAEIMISSRFGQNISAFLISRGFQPFSLVDFCRDAFHSDSPGQTVAGVEGNGKYKSQATGVMRTVTMHLGIRFTVWTHTMMNPWHPVIDILTDLHFGNICISTDLCTLYQLTCFSPVRYTARLVSCYRKLHKEASPVIDSAWHLVFVRFLPRFPASALRYTTVMRGGGIQCIPPPPAITDLVFGKCLPRGVFLSGIDHPNLVPFPVMKRAIAEAQVRFPEQEAFNGTTMQRIQQVHALLRNTAMGIAEFWWRAWHSFGKPNTRTLFLHVFMAHVMLKFEEASAVRSVCAVLKIHISDLVNACTGHESPTKPVMTRVDDVIGMWHSLDPNAMRVAILQRIEPFIRKHGAPLALMHACYTVAKVPRLPVTVTPVVQPRHQFTSTYRVAAAVTLNATPAAAACNRHKYSARLSNDVVSYVTHNFTGTREPVAHETKLNRHFHNEHIRVFPRPCYNIDIEASIALPPMISRRVQPPTFPVTCFTAREAQADFDSLTTELIHTLVSYCTRILQHPFPTYESDAKKQSELDDFADELEMLMADGTSNGHANGTAGLNAVPWHDLPQDSFDVAATMHFVAKMTRTIEEQVLTLRGIGVRHVPHHALDPDLSSMFRHLGRVLVRNSSPLALEFESLTARMQ